MLAVLAEEVLPLYKQAAAVQVSQGWDCGLAFALADEQLVAAKGKAECRVRSLGRIGYIGYKSLVHATRSVFSTVPSCVSFPH